MGGNAVLNKPDETNYSTSLKLKELADQAGLGDQYMPHPFTFAQTNRILEDDRICGLAFTGSTAVGKYVGSIAARNIKIVTLELGGNDPMFVFADAN
eukprot:CAMPEP_0168314338 /NCGR_PEP_ID=MMETSP0210-20121227/7237_1 /TAXON_ID=40633 /ORGANISM="Condylostoma magnum, Strain COL2" /LENGTH=96 /DNA_ID=CAMNT_0008280587 /DNA_START=601 /DNA_END=891 /DNA_ORIENTATION=+